MATRFCSRKLRFWLALTSLQTSNTYPCATLVPVVSLSRANMFLVVNPSFPAKTVSELVAMAKQRPGELQYVNPGSGTPPHLAAIAFTRVTATVMAPISYRGAGRALADLMAGHVPIIFLGLSASQSGRVRCRPEGEPHEASRVHRCAERCGGAADYCARTTATQDLADRGTGERVTRT